MKFIVKGNEPSSFTEWKWQANQNWQPTFAYLQHPEKQELLKALLDEQGYVCCYCGRSIDAEGSHIEHFRPQKLRPDLELDYSNLHASCIREGKPKMPLHCGHRKGDWFDEGRHISPTDAGCEQRFFYTLSGEIRSIDKDALYMSELLGLGIDFLCNRREEVLKGIFDDDFLVSASNDELVRVRDTFRAAENERLPNFCHIVARYAEQLLGGTYQTLNNKEIQ